MGKTSFVLGSSWASRMLDVPDEDFAIIVKAVFRYAVDGDDTDVSGLHKALVAEMTNFIAGNNERYEEVCRKRREAGSLGGKQKVANAKQMLPNATKCLAKGSKRVHDNDNDNDNDYEHDTDNVNDNDVLTDNKKRVEANASKREILDALIAKWNSYRDRGNIPLIKSVSTDSKCGKSVIARVQEHGLEEVVEVMDSVFESDFLRGKDGKWNAKFDWMFLPNNFEKIMNGNYSNRKTSSEEQMDVLFSVADEAIGDGDPFKYFSGKEFL